MILMKKAFFILVLFALAFTAHAQEDCDFTIVTAEDGSEFKSTKEYLMYEKVFGGTSQFIFFSLSNNEGVPVLNFQLLSKSRDFTKIYCLDQSSRIYLQLTNGKIITLINALEEQCSGLMYDSSEKTNIRVLTSSFLFTKGSLEDLEKYPIAFMRIKYTTETVDYPVRKELASETTSVKYFPESYFINNLKCLQ